MTWSFSGRTLATRHSDRWRHTCGSQGHTQLDTLKDIPLAFIGQVLILNTNDLLVGKHTAKILGE